MEDKTVKKILALVVIAIVVLSIFVGIIFKQEVIEEGDESKLIAQIQVDSNSGTAPFDASFKPLVLNKKGDVEYLWDFGDGTTSEEENPKHTYELNGSYICTLKVNDERGKEKTDTVEILAKKNKPPVVTLSINQNTLNRGFNWLEILSLTPIAGYAGNQQLLLDMVENKKGADAWGEGRLVVTAQILDPEDDEIVSYDWKVQNADSVVTSPITGSKEWLPVKNLTGEESVIIPELYAWMDKVHVVILTVTDSAGNNATADIQFTVSQSLTLTKIKGIKNGIKTGLPFLGMLWGLQFVEEPVSNILDEIWFDLPPTLQKLILTILGFLDWDYDPPVPKTDLDFSEISDLNLSAYVNDTGVVQPDAFVRSDFVISNIDNNTAENVYVTLDNPIANADDGLAVEIEVEDLMVDLEAGIMSNKLFYNGKYTNYTDCYNVEKIAPGDLVNLGIVVTLKEGAIFNKGTYNCKLYVYQGETLQEAENVDEIPFTIEI